MNHFRMWRLCVVFYEVKQSENKFVFIICQNWFLLFVGASDVYMRYNFPLV
jgi:hypothetical protein